MNANEIRSLMPQNIRTAETLLKEINDLIIETAKNDEYLVDLPKSILGDAIHHEVFYNAKFPTILLEVMGNLKERGFKVLKNTTNLTLTISWKI